MPFRSNTLAVTSPAAPAPITATLIGLGEDDADAAETVAVVTDERLMSFVEVCVRVTSVGE